MLSKDCWLPLVERIASMLAAVGGAANRLVVAKVREIRRSLGEVFILTFGSYEVFESDYLYKSIQHFRSKI